MLFEEFAQLFQPSLQRRPESSSAHCVHWSDHIWPLATLGTVTRKVGLSHIGHWLTPAFLRSLCCWGVYMIYVYIIYHIVYTGLGHHFPSIGKSKTLNKCRHLIFEDDKMFSMLFSFLFGAETHYVWFMPGSTRILNISRNQESFWHIWSICHSPAFSAVAKERSDILFIDLIGEDWSLERMVVRSRSLVGTCRHVCTSALYWGLLRAIRKRWNAPQIGKTGNTSGKVFAFPACSMAKSACCLSSSSYSQGNAW